MMKRLLNLLAKVFPSPAPTPVPVPVRDGKNSSGVIRFDFAGETMTGWFADASGKRVLIGAVSRRGKPHFVVRKRHQVSFI